MTLETCHCAAMPDLAKVAALNDEMRRHNSWGDAIVLSDGIRRRGDILSLGYSANSVPMTTLRLRPIRRATIRSVAF